MVTAAALSLPLVLAVVVAIGATLALVAIGATLALVAVTREPKKSAAAGRGAE